MKIRFENLEKRYERGMTDFLHFHGIAEGDGGITVSIDITGGDTLTVVKRGAQASFSLPSRFQVFRAVTLLKGLAEKSDAVYTERVYFDTCGAMFDGSQANSLMNTESCKKMMLLLAGMGYNMMMLYCEDCYEITGEPYFGNMRPRYTKAEFRLLDDYAYSLGIELVPCMQTLGHLVEAIKKPPYHAISDTETVLLVGNEGVYALLDKMIGTMSECFRSRRIHIGLDEAWRLGLGTYLEKNGYTHPYKIMTEHLARIAEITRKYGLQPMMWNDMFFRSKDTGGDYYQDESFNFTSEDIAAVPKDFSLVYWDYYHDTPEEYVNMLRLSKQLSDKVIFAGCVRNVFTFATSYEKTEVTTNAALTACKRAGIRETVATVWGDNQTESSSFSILPGLTLYAEHMYAEAPDKERIRERLFEATGAIWDDFMDINALDDFDGHKTDRKWDYCLTRAIMWQDILLGLYDFNLGDADYESHYRSLTLRLKKSAERYPHFKYMFDFYAALSSALELKSTAGRKLYAAYKSDDKGALKDYTDTLLPELSARVQTLRGSHRDYFLTEFKPIGWEVLDIRYGGAIMRIDTAIKRIRDYLDGKISKIDELEEERLPYSAGGHPVKIFYQSVCSASSI